MKVTYEFNEPAEAEERAIYEKAYESHQLLLRMDSLLFDLRKDLLELFDGEEEPSDLVGDQLEEKYTEARDSLIDFVCGVVDLMDKANVQGLGY